MVDAHARCQVRKKPALLGSLQLSTASPLNADILSSVRALHLENSLSAIHSTQPQQCSGRQDQAAADMTEIPSSSEGNSCSHFYANIWCQKLFGIVTSV